MIRKSINVRNYFFIVSMFFCLSVWSQHNHGGEDHDENEDLLAKHTAQHGGEVIDAGKHKFEVIFSPMQSEEKLVVYVLKKNLKSFYSSDMSGTVEIKYKDGLTEEISLSLLSDKLACNPGSLDKVANYCFKIIINKKCYKACCFYNGLIK